MEAKTRKKIEAVLDEAAELSEQGQDEYAAARHALTGQTSDVLRELAVAAIVDAVRRRQRANVLSIEKSAERTPRRATEQAWKTEEYYETASKKQAAFWAEMQQHVERYADALKVEWTSELLASDFALADGSRVTWGEATVEQHEQRAAMFQRNVVANAEGAARHVHALQALRQSGRATLNDLVGVAA